MVKINCNEDCKYLEGLRRQEKGTEDKKFSATIYGMSREKHPISMHGSYLPLNTERDFHIPLLSSKYSQKRHPLTEVAVAYTAAPEGELNLLLS